MKFRFLLLIVIPLSFSFSKPVELLVKFKTNRAAEAAREFRIENGGNLDLVSAAGSLYRWQSEQNLNFSWNNSIEYVQENHPISLFPNPSVERSRTALLKELAKHPADVRATREDNPDFVAPVSESKGADPLISKSWGLSQINALEMWKKSKQGEGIVVAVIDTGVDYTHEDLINNIWHKDGHVDEIGYDFVDNDNKPYDLAGSLIEILLSGANPGHGTHVSGVIGARLENSKGTAGVAPMVKIMALRFISKEGKGTTDNAIKAIDYAVANGAKIINASWGGEKGEDDDKALEDSIKRAGEKGVIFVAAAGNGRLKPGESEAHGFDLDTDDKPVLPAAFDLPNLVTVAATDSNDGLAGFSNWGKKLVKVGAPGVKILSSTPGNQYQDTVIDIGPVKATWDGTSMATPFVVGSLASLWAEHPDDTMPQIIDRLYSNTKPVSALDGKVKTGGRIYLK